MAINLPILSSLNTTGFDKAKKEFDALATKADKAAFLLKKSMVPAVAALSGLAAFGKKAADAASDLNEEVSKSKQIFGTSAGAIESFANSAAKELGQSKTEALQAAATFGVMGQAAGLAGSDLTKFSTDLVKLTSDIASFNNASPAEVALALGAALRGEAEPMRRFGVLLDDAALKAEAMRMGIYKGNGVLGQQEKILAANKIIFEKTALAQGDFERTSSGAANQQRILSANIKDATAKLGQSFLPILEAVLPILNKFATWAADNPKVFANVALSMGLIAGAIIAINAAMLLNPFVAIAAAVGAAIVVVVGLYTKFEKFRIVVHEVANAVIGYFEKMINNWIDGINLFVKGLNGISTALSWVGVDLGKITEISKVSFGRLGSGADSASEKAYKLAKGWSEVNTNALNATPTITKNTAATANNGAASEKTAKKVKKLVDNTKELKAAFDEAVQVVKDKFSPALMKANEQLAGASETYNEFYNSTREVVTGLFNIGDAFTSAAESKGAETFFGNLEEQAKKAGELAQGIEDLIAAGLNDPELLRSILAAGGDTGLEIIKSILAGGKESIDRLAGLSKTVGDAATKIATITADKWFKSGVTQAENLVKGVQSVIDATEFELKFVTTIEGAQAAGATFEQNLQTVTGGGTIATPSNPFGGVLGSINAEPNTIYQNNPGAVSSQSININVNGGDPNAVVSALRTYMRQNGSVPIKTSNNY